MKVTRCETENCRGIATHVYGPVCCSDNLMYLCALHAKKVGNWLLVFAREPVKCPTHGDVGPAKDAVFLGKM